MLVKLKRGLHRVEKSLSRPFRSRGRKKNIYLGHMDWDGLRSLADVLHQAGTFRSLATAVAKLSECIEMFDDQARTREEYQQLRVDLNDLCQILASYLDKAPLSEATTGIITNLAGGIDMESESLLQEKGGGFDRDPKLARDVSEVLRGYSRLRTLLGRFVVNENTRIWHIPIETAPLGARLDRLPHPVAAWYSSSGPDIPRRNGCTLNTRVDLLKQLRDWARYNINHQRLYWLNGTAGMGKTTIAYSLCEHLENSGKLAASFFCTRRLPRCRDANAIIPSISHQLSSFSRPFRHAISDIISQGVDVDMLPVQEQFESLIARPLQQTGYTFPPGVVVVIDAIDECGDDGGVDQILNALLVHASDLPVKFFVTSRPQSKIVRRMQSGQGNDMIREKRLHELDHSGVREDVKTYMRAELAPANPSANDIDRLCELSGPSFEHAAIIFCAATYLGAPNELSECSGYWILPPRFRERMTNGWILEITLVLHTVICAREPLTVDTLAGLLGLSVARLVTQILQRLRLVLQISGTNGLVIPRHASLPRYLSEQNRSGRFYCDKMQHNVWLAETCFDLIKVPEPLPDGQGSETSYPRGREGPDVNGGAKMILSQELLYAYRYWGVHQEAAGHSKASEAAERLKQRLDLFTAPEIDAFYTALLQRVLDGGTLQDPRTAGIILVLHTVVCAQATLTVNAITDLLGVDGADLICSLMPLLQVSEKGGRVTALHSSLSCNILDGKRAGEFYCDAKQHSSWLAHACFELIRIPDPPFNICNLPSSYLFDREVPDIETRVSNAISPGLLYACQYWGDYVTVSDASGALLEAMDEFLSVRLLLWMEILNLKRRVGDGINLLHRLLNWLRGLEGYDSIQQTIRDARRFMTLLLHSPVSESTPHIYVSILPFWLEHRPVSTKYLPKMSGLVRVSGSGMGLEKPRTITAFHAGREASGVAYSPDGAYIVSGSSDKTIHIWDANTGQLAGQPLIGHTNLVSSVAYSPNGAYIVSGSHDNTIRIWDAHTRQPVGQPLQGHKYGVLSVALSPDGAYIISGSHDNTIRTWNAHTGQPVGQPLEGHTSSVYSVGYSLDGAYIVSGSADKTICIWDARTQQPIGRPLVGHINSVISVAYSPGGAHIVSGSQDGTIRIWDAYTQQPAGQPLKGQTDPVFSVAYSPDGRYILSGSHDNNACIWDAHTRQPLGRPLTGHKGSVKFVAYSPDGMYIVSSSDDETIRIWEATTEQQPLSGHTGSVYSVAYSPDGAYIVSGSYDDTVCIWDAHTGQLLGQPLIGHASWVSSVAYSPDGAYIVSGSADQTLRIWDAYTGQPVGQPLIGHTRTVTTIACSPDGAHVASGSHDCTIRIWDTRTNQLLGQPLRGHADSILSVAYSPDCKHVVSGARDNTICIWDAYTGQPLVQSFKGHTSSVTSVAYSPDGAYIVSGACDMVIQIWDARTGQPTRQPFKGHTSLVDSVAYSSDGAYIVSGSHDETIRIWDTNSGEPVGQPFKGHTKAVSSVAYSPNGAFIVSGSHDNTIRIWSTRAGCPASQLPKGHPTSQHHPPASIAATNLSHALLPNHEAVSLGDWTLDDQGWMIDSKQNRIVWVPPHARETLQVGQSPIVISSEGSFQLDFQGATLGEGWQHVFGS